MKTILLLSLITAGLGVSSAAGISSELQSARPYNAAMPAASETTWQLVKNISDLKDGSEIAVTANSQYIVPVSENTSSGKYGAAGNYVKSFTITDGVPNIPFDTGYFKLKKHGETENVYKMLCGVDNSYAFGASNNSTSDIGCNTSYATNSDAWTFSVSSSGSATIKYTNSSYARLLKGDKDGDGFKFYSSSSDGSAPKIYLKVSSEAPVIESIEASGSVKAYCGQTIDFSPLTITGNIQGGGTKVIDLKDCTFSTTTAQSTVGTQTVQVTYNADSYPSCNVTVNVVEKPSKTVYSLVTDATTLKAGDKIVIACTSASKVLSSFDTKYYTAADIEIDGNNLLVGDADSANIFTLGDGSSGSFTLLSSLNNKYLTRNNNDLSESNTVTDNSKWTFSYSLSGMAISSYSDSTQKIFYNSTGTGRFKNYTSSTMASVNVYKYSSGAEKIKLSDEVKDIYLNSEFVLTATAESFSATSWEFTASNSKVQITGTGNARTIKGLETGSSVIEVTANGTYHASCIVNIVDITYDVLTRSNYGIMSPDCTYYMNPSTVPVKDLDLSNISNTFTFEKAYLGDNTYYIKNASNYYVYWTHDGSKLGTSLEKNGHWTVSKDSSGDYCLMTDGRYLSFFIDSSSKPNWYVFSDKHTVKLLGALSFTNITYTGTLAKTSYDLGDEFDPKGLTFYANYEDDEHNVVSRKFEGEITWDELATGTSVTGHCEVAGVSRSVVVTGLNVSDYAPEELVLDHSSVQKNYKDGEYISLTGLNAKVKYSNGSATYKYRDLVIPDDISYSPEKASLSTSEVTISWNKNSSIKASYNINVLESHFVTLNRLVPGNTVVIANLNYTPYDIVGGHELTVNGSTTASESYGYKPNATSTFVVEQGISTGTYSFKNTVTNKYLRRDGDTLGFKKDTNYSIVDSGSGYGFEYYRNGSVYADFSNDWGTQGQSNIEKVLVGANGTWTQYATTVLYTDGTFKIFPYSDAATWDVTTLTGEIDYGSWAFESSEYKLSCSTGSDEKDATSSFTCVYDRNERYWTMSNKVDSEDAYVYYNTTASKFRCSKNYETSYYDIMFYAEETSTSAVSISVNTDNVKTTYNVGDKFEWTEAVVTASYGGGIFNTLPLNSYTVSTPDMSTKGTKTVTIDHFGLQTSYTITVNKVVPVVKLEKLEIISYKDSYLVGDTKPEFVAEAVYSDGTRKDVSSLCQIEGFYTATPSTGLRTVTLTYKEKGETTQQAQFKYTVVAVPAVDEVKITETSISEGLVVGGHYQIVIKTLNGETVSSEGQESAIQRLKFSSSNEEVATVDSNGYVTFVGLGECNISIEARDGSGKDKLHVFLKGKTTDIQVDSLEGEVRVGEDYQIYATPIPAEASGETLKYSSSNNAIATVNIFGNVKGVKAGQVDITITSADGTISKVVKITVKDPTPVPPGPDSSSSSIGPTPTSSSTTSTMPTTSEVPTTSLIPTSSGDISSTSGVTPTPTPTPTDNNSLVITLCIIGGTVLLAATVSVVIIVCIKKRK